MKLEELKNKTILVTGGAKRIAKSIILDLAKFEPKWIIHYRTSEKEAQEVLSSIQAYNPNSYLIQSDFSKEDDRKRFFETIEKEEIHIVINSASIFPDFDNWENFDYDNYRKIFDVNFFTPSYIIKKVFFKKEHQGIVINFLDASLRFHRTDHFLYRLSKYCLEKLTYMLAKELAPNVRVNGISPGAILPPAQINKEGIINESWNPVDYYEKSIKKIPLRLPGSPDYITHAVRFIIENDFLTGINIPVDGGENL
ncbi:MAG: SDR family oxidoreductase [Leptospiraceae bacterium]|nr:SDR family oxidoreductase [Leptospiraceae bacterium]MDW7975947.1 SDR family oxidoreductase [Leptospiraceae bacterium]